MTDDKKKKLVVIEGDMEAIKVDDEQLRDVAGGAWDRYNGFGTGGTDADAERERKEAMKKGG